MSLKNIINNLNQNYKVNNNSNKIILTLEKHLILIWTNNKKIKEDKNLTMNLQLWIDKRGIYHREVEKEWVVKEIYNREKILVEMFQ